MKHAYFALTLLAVQQASAQLPYPATRKVDTVDNYHGTAVADPYRWLEDDNSDETKAWVKAQNVVTQGYLSQVPYRDKVRQRLQELWNYTRYGAPSKKGAWWYFTKNDGLQNQSVWYRQKMLNGKAEVFLDPNKLSQDGTVALGSTAFSKDGSLFVYALQKAGSDWQEAHVMHTENGKKLTDSLQWLKFTGFAWKSTDGFFYSRYPAPSAEDKLKGKNLHHSLYYHKLGTPQSQDPLVYEDREHPERLIFSNVTEDERFLVVYVQEGSVGVSEIFVKDLAAKDAPFIKIKEGFTTQATVIDNVDDRFLVLTNDNASNYKVVLVDSKNPAKKAWKEIIPEGENVLERVGTGGGYLFPSYLKDASTKVFQYTYEGKPVREIKLPGIGSAGGFGAKKEDKEFFYYFTSYNYPTSIFKYNIESGATALHKKAEVRFNPEDYEVKQVFFKSKDGTRVPMFLTYKKGLVLNGQNPAMMYGYGGFNVSETPAFSVSNLFFIEQGGVYADVVLRGGSEYGEDWHKAGMLDKKQNVFDDYIGAAEWLIQNKYTNSGKLAITGGSNGGLLVGAAMTQRPELFKVAVPRVGVLDMLRYHRFTIGYAWASEYGSSDKPDQFPYLYKYSPLHNLKKGVAYPATMVVTSDHDDRVVPAHSFKFAAALQEANSGQHPALIRIETNAGHGAGLPTSKAIDAAADVWSFVLYNTGAGFREVTPGNGKAAAKTEVKKAF